MQDQRARRGEQTLSTFKPLNLWAVDPGGFLARVRGTLKHVEKTDEGRRNLGCRGTLRRSRRIGGRSDQQCAQSDRRPTHALPWIDNWK